MKKLVRLELQQIHPTQITAGMLEVDEKRKHFASLPAEALKRALKALPIPAVLGRDGTHFATDHHHLARALFDAQINYAYVEVMADLSKLKGDAFWLEMANRRWVHPYDEHGILHGVAAIPSNVSGLIDDPYRSLAAFVRNAGGYIKTPEPFAEFFSGQISFGLASACGAHRFNSAPPYSRGCILPEVRTRWCCRGSTKARMVVAQTRALEI
jgi:hypothetical protein